jgi:DNA-binding beta-propeller fold protein YncE
VLPVTHDLSGTPIPVGSDPQGIDITPNGKTLYVADSGGQTISKVTIATGKVKTIATRPGA